MERHQQSISIRRYCDGKGPLNLVQEHRWLFHEGKKQCPRHAKEENLSESFDNGKRIGLPRISVFCIWGPLLPPRCSDANAIFLYIAISPA